MNRSGGAMTFIALGFEVAVSVVAGVLLGLWLDEKLGTSPLLLLVGCVVGMAGAVQRVLAYTRFFRRSSDEQEPRDRQE